MQLDDLRENDEMDMSDDDRDAPRSAKRVKFDNRSLMVRTKSKNVLDFVVICAIRLGGE